MLILPYRIDRPFRMPWATISIMVLCIAMFILQLSMGLERSFALLGFRLSPTAAFTWLTSMFMHGGVMHLVGNMYFLWVFGGVLEDAIGRLKYVMLYIAGGLVAALTHSLIMLAAQPGHADIPLVGASGAIAAIMGVSAVRFYRLKLEVVYWFFLRPGVFKVSASFGVLMWALMQLPDAIASIGGANNGVANWAHIGGAVFGALVAYAFGLAKDLDREDARATAAAYSAIGRSDLAAAALASADASDEARGMVARARAMHAAQSGDPVRARELASAALQKLLTDGRRAEMIDCYRELEAGVTDAPVADARAIVAVGTAAESQGRLGEAARAYYDVLRYYPQAPEAERALFRLAHVYLALGRHDDAVATYRSFVTHFSASPWTVYADSRLAAAVAGAA